MSFISPCIALAVCFIKGQVDFYLQEVVLYSAAVAHSWQLVKFVICESEMKWVKCSTMLLE